MSDSVDCPFCGRTMYVELEGDQEWEQECENEDCSATFHIEVEYEAYLIASKPEEASHD